MLSSIFSFKQYRAALQKVSRLNRWLLPVLVCSLLLTVFAAGFTLQRLSPSDPAASRRADHEALNEHTEVLIAGTSHVTAGINPAGIHGLQAMNVSVDAADYEILGLLFKQAVRKAPNARKLLLELDPLPLFYRIKGARKDFQQMYDHGLTRRDLTSSLGEYFWSFVYDLPLMRDIYFRERFNPKQLSWKQPRQRIPSGPGFYPYTLTMDDTRNGPVRAEQHAASLDPGNGDRNLRHLLELCAEAESRGMEVILVRYPHAEGYFETLPSAWHERFNKAIEAVTTGTTRAYWDFADAAAFTPADFHDGHHLNQAGAEKLTDRVAARLSPSE